MIDAAALSTTKMNPPETSQSKKFRRKKRSSFQSMTFLWLSHIFFTALLLFWNWKTSLPKKAASRVRGLTTDHRSVNYISDDFKIVFQGQYLIGWRLQFRLPKKVIGFGCHHPTTDALENFLVFGWVLLNRAQILTRGIFGCCCQSLLSMLIGNALWEPLGAMT